jgi:hypothetical protein
MSFSRTTSSSTSFDIDDETMKADLEKQLKEDETDRKLKEVEADIERIAIAEREKKALQKRQCERNAIAMRRLESLATTRSAFWGSFFDVKVEEPLIETKTISSKQEKSEVVSVLVVDRAKNDRNAFDDANDELTTTASTTVPLISELPTGSAEIESFDVAVESISNLILSLAEEPTELAMMILAGIDASAADETIQETTISPVTKKDQHPEANSDIEELYQLPIADSMTSTILAETGDSNPRHILLPVLIENLPQHDECLVPFINSTQQQHLDASTSSTSPTSLPTASLDSILLPSSKNVASPRSTEHSYNVTPVSDDASAQSTEEEVIDLVLSPSILSQRAPPLESVAMRSTSGVANNSDSEFCVDESISTFLFRDDTHIYML